MTDLRRKELVLDQGFVRLVDWMGDDLSVVRAARVSFDADWRVGDDVNQDERLIRYLMKHKHTSPFEAVTFTFEVKAPIFVLRQWHRHRTWSYNEVSARYAELDEGSFIPYPDTITRQSADNKQARTAEPHELRHQFAKMIAAQNRESLHTYEDLIQAGCPRELARCVLPVATYSRMFATVDLHNLLHFLRLRLHPHAQFEIRVYAEAVLAIIRDVVPVSVAAFEESLYD